MKPHSIPIRIYYEDTDAGGVVYHANHLKFGERGRTELLRFMGFENKSLFDKYGVIFVVRHLEANYLMPAHLDDLLRLETAVLEVKNASVIMEHSLFRENAKLFAMDVTLVCVDGENYRPISIPDEIKDGFKRYIKEA